MAGEDYLIAFDLRRYISLIEHVLFIMCW